MSTSLLSTTTTRRSTRSATRTGSRRTPMWSAAPTRTRRQAARPGGAAPAGQLRRASDLDDDPDDDLPIGRLRAGSGATSGDGGGATA